MFDNSIEPAKTIGTTRKVQATEEMPIREATQAEEKRHRQSNPHTDAVAKQHNLYTSDRWSTRIYYADYQQKSEVMRAKPQQITTKLDDRQTVSAMLDLAQSRGWQTIKLHGSDNFRREAWVQSHVRGIKTEGYAQKNTDMQEAERRKVAAAPVATPAKAAAQRETKKTKAQPQRSDEKAVWNIVETSGKVAREQDGVKSAEKPVEKPPSAAVAA